jgi:hypothetical protein
LIREVCRAGLGALPTHAYFTVKRTNTISRLLLVLGRGIAHTTPAFVIMKDTTPQNVHMSTLCTLTLDCSVQKEEIGLVRRRLIFGVLRPVIAAFCILTLLHFFSYKCIWHQCIVLL